MSAKFREQMAKAEADRKAMEARQKADEDARARQFSAGKNAAATLDSYDASDLRTGGRDRNLSYNDRNSFEWGPWLLRKILLGFNGFFLILGFIIMVLGGVASSASFSSVAGKSWTVGIAIIGMFIFIIGAIGALGAYTKNRLILMIYFVLLVCMLIVVFIIGCYIAASAPSTLIRNGWNSVSNDSQTTLQNYYQCCGLNDYTDSAGWPCPTGTFNPSTNITTPLTGCMPLFVSSFQQNFSAIGWMGIVTAIVMGVCALATYALYRMLSALAPKFTVGRV